VPDLDAAEPRVEIAPAFLAIAEGLVARLALPPRTPWVLEALILLEIDPAVTAERQRADEQGRKGVLSWLCLRADAAKAAIPEDEVEDAVDALVSWGLAQVVGQNLRDPLVSGSAALRLTHPGRAALGLAPRDRPRCPPLALQDAPSAWEIWHGASREGLLWEARLQVGQAALTPLKIADPRAQPEDLAGRLALALLRDGVAVIDLFGASVADYGPLMEKLLLRTSAARGRRIVLTSNPAVVRIAAVLCGATFRWVEIPLHGSQHVGLFDQRLTSQLMAGHVPPGTLQVAVCGMPESDRAIPRRVSIQWDDMLFAPSVRHQLDQALAHARYRVLTLPGRPGFPGRGSGYRLLLSGVPGTGKSMASEALASALDRPMLTLDLSAVLSRWLGETEKFLSQVFEMAELSGCLLLLDEAESLFQQRKGDEGGGGGGGGGGAMQTIVAFLLTRLERYSGILVATTNRVKDLDEAFFRRFDDFIVVPLPDLATRARMWRRMLSLHGGDGAVDVDLLSRKFAISGGLVRGASLRALAWAEIEGRPPHTALVLAALARELEKNDRSSNEALVEPYRAEVQALLRGHAGSAWD